LIIYVYIQLLFWWRFTNVSEVLDTLMLRVMMQAASTPESLVSLFQTTQLSISEDSQIQDLCP
jgi:hypothetical protein